MLNVTEKYRESFADFRVGGIGIAYDGEALSKAHLRFRMFVCSPPTRDPFLIFMKKYILLPILLALGLVAFLPQTAKAHGYFDIYVGPAYCDPYPGYYGGYYPHYYRQYYHDDNPYRYGYWRHHRHWHHDDDD
jgi:hypothetical protein